MHAIIATLSFGVSSHCCETSFMSSRRKGVTVKDFARSLPEVAEGHINERQKWQRRVNERSFIKLVSSIIR